MGWVQRPMGDTGSYREWEGPPETTSSSTASVTSSQQTQSSSWDCGPAIAPTDAELAGRGIGMLLVLGLGAWFLFAPQGFFAVLRNVADKAATMAQGNAGVPTQKARKKIIALPDDLRASLSERVKAARTRFEIIVDEPNAISANAGMFNNVHNLLTLWERVDGFAPERTKPLQDLGPLEFGPGREPEKLEKAKLFWESYVKNGWTPYDDENISEKCARFAELSERLPKLSAAEKDELIQLIRWSMLAYDKSDDGTPVQRFQRLVWAYEVTSGNDLTGLKASTEEWEALDKLRDEKK